jgi:nitrogen-specific signal transduction histidine kinase
VNLENIKNHDENYENMIFLKKFIEVFTKNLEIKNKDFYKKINKKIKFIDFMHDIEYTTEGITNIEKILNQQINQSGSTIYGTMSILGSLFKIIHDIYEESSRFTDPKKVRYCIESTLNELGDNNPSMVSQIIQDTQGETERQSNSERSTYNTTVTDHMISFIIENYVNQLEKIKNSEKYQNSDLKNIRAIFKGGGDYLVKIMNDLDIIRKTSIDERSYFSIYMRLEDFIVKNSSFNSDTLRGSVREIFNTKWFEPKLNVIFNVKDIDILVFYQIILESLINKANQNKIDLAKLNDLINSKILKNIILEEKNALFDDAEKYIFSLGKDDAIKEIGSTINLIYKFCIGSFGKNRTDELLEVAFNDVKVIYGEIKKFQDAVELLPPGIMTRGRMSISNPSVHEALKIAENATTLLGGTSANIFIEKINECVATPSENQELSLINIYREIENFVDKNKIVIKGRYMSGLEFRELVRNMSHIENLSRVQKIYLLERNEQIAQLSIQFIDMFSKNSGLDKLINVFDYKKSVSNSIDVLKNSLNQNGDIDVSVIFKNLRNVKESLREKELVMAISEMLNYLYRKSVSLMGEKDSNTFLKITYDVMRKTYGSVTSEIFSLLPDSILSDEDRYNLLKDCFKKISQTILEDQRIHQIKNDFLEYYKTLENRIEQIPLDTKKDSSLTSIFKDFFSHVHEEIRLKYGKEGTEHIFEDAYDRIKKDYYGFPIFSNVLSAMPKDILETEKINMLSKEELENLSRSLKKTEIMKAEFTNIAAHELKTPLVPLKGFLDIMRQHPEKYGLNDKGLEYVEVCYRNVNRLNELVGDILDISKLEAGEMKFDMQGVNMVDLLRNCTKDFSIAMQQKGIVFETNIPDSLPIISGDTQRLTQVIENLINNSMKFTEKGKIKLQAQLVDNFIQVTISDTGVGIDKMEIDRLFTKFFEAQSVITRNTTGTGLGLAISKEIIEAHHGHIWAESEGLGKGSVFSFTIPIKDVENKV